MLFAETSVVRSLQRGLKIINVVADHGPLHAKPLARSIGVALPTTYHLLRTLVHVGYLERLSDGSYVLGRRLGEDSSSWLHSPAPAPNASSLNREVAV